MSGLGRPPAGQTARVGEIDLQYVEAGSGPAVLMLHGGGPGASGYSNFERNLEVFARDHRVIVPDLPGYGGSSKPDVQVGLYGYLADAIRGLMDHLGIDQADIVGNSLGGGTALRLATAAPERVRRLVLMGPGGSIGTQSPSPSEGIKLLWSYYLSPGPSRERLLAFLKAMVFDPAQLTDALIDARYAASIEPDAMREPLLVPKRRRLIEPLWRDVAQVHHKTLLIWGRDDRTIPLDHAWMLLNQLPDARLMVFSRTGHWAQWERPEEFNRLALSFLAEHSDQPDQPE